MREELIQIACVKTYSTQAAKSKVNSEAEKIRKLAEKLGFIVLVEQCFVDEGTK